MSTLYHAACIAHELTRRSSSDSLAKFGASLFNATADLNPHQLDAALFAFKSPTLPRRDVCRRSGPKPAPPSHGASDHERAHGGKPWRYLLIPHTAVTPAATLAGLAATYRMA